MNTINHITADDFAADPSFAEWVRQPSDPRHAFWAAWVAQHPDRWDTVSQAIAMVQTIQGLYDSDQLTERQAEENVQRIITAAQLSDQRPVKRLGQLPGWRPWSSVVAAAVLLLVAGLWYQQIQSGGIQTAKTDAHESALLTRTNKGTHPITVLLSDGSVVTLESKSSLSFPRAFASDVRLVKLTGEAFFDITKNPKRPFLVRTARSMTRVLGTSFHVRDFQQRPVSVVVRTGRVAVYALPKAGNQPATSAASSVLLPNQRAEITDGVLTKTNILNRSAVAPIQVGPSEITFDDQPVTEVLAALARLYEVNINVEQGGLSTCRITTSFAEETLPERLSSICRAINATYRIEADRIDIAGHGCPAATNSPNE